MCLIIPWWFNVSSHQPIIIVSYFSKILVVLAEAPLQILWCIIPMAFKKKENIWALSYKQLRLIAICLRLVSIANMYI